MVHGVWVGGYNFLQYGQKFAGFSLRWLGPCLSSHTQNESVDSKYYVAAPQKRSYNRGMMNSSSYLSNMISSIDRR
jgi:hypothetical protein